jgi:hypothetical protein
MSGVKVTIPKAGQLASIFGGFHSALPNRLRKAASEARRLLVADLAEYPPEAPGQRYVRTYELQRGWQRASPIVGTQFELVNSSDHARWTQADDQAWMHVGRWKTASEIAQEHEAEIVKEFDDAVKEMTDGR